jgi:hypothetical protein
MSKRKPYRSSKLAQKKRKQRKIKIILWTVLFISIIAGASYWSGHDSVVVSQINISENEFINDQDVLEKASQIISGRHLFLFSKSNFLLIPQSKIEDYILDTFPSAKDVDIKVKFNEMEIVINEHQAVAKWCGIDFNDPSDCYLLNDWALIFAKENIIEEKEVIEFYGLTDATTSEEIELVGQRHIEQGVYDRILVFLNNLNQLEINPIFVDTTDKETFAVYTERGPYLLIEKNDDPNEVLNNLKTVIETEELNDAQFKNLEYIDLRFGNKVYYKIR